MFCCQTLFGFIFGSDLLFVKFCFSFLAFFEEFYLAYLFFCRISYLVFLSQSTFIFFDVKLFFTFFGLNCFSVFFWGILLILLVFLSNFILGFSFFRQLSFVFFLVSNSSWPFIRSDLLFCQFFVWFLCFFEEFYLVYLFVLSNSSRFFFFGLKCVSVNLMFGFVEVFYLFYSFFGQFLY